MYDENTSSLQFLSDLKEPKEVFIMRYQFNCEDSSNREKQLDSDFTIKYAEYNLTFRFMKFFDHYQKQMDILDILAEYIDLKLQKDLDIVLERIMPKTSVSISFFSNN
jgi:hypothetical protein